MDYSYNREPREAARPPSISVSEVDGGRTASRSNRQQDVVGDQLESDCATGIGKMPGAQDRRGVRIRAQLAGGASRAVLRRFQVTEEIVVFEGRDREEDAVDCHSHA